MTPTLERLEKKNLMTAVAVDVVIAHNTDGSDSVDFTTTSVTDDGSTNVTYNLKADPSNPSDTAVEETVDPNTGETAVVIQLPQLPPLPTPPVPPAPTKPTPGVIYNPVAKLAPPFLIYYQTLPPGFVGPPQWYQVPIGGPITPVAPGTPGGPLPNPMPLQPLPPLPGGPAQSLPNPIQNGTINPSVVTPSVINNSGPITMDMDFDLFDDENGDFNFYAYQDTATTTVTS